MMRALAYSLAIVLVSSTALAQAPGDTGNGSNLTNIGYGESGYMYSPHSSTFAEGVGRGVGDVMRSAGQLLYAGSLAAINFNEAQRLALDNRLKGVNTYFEARRRNEQLRAEMRGRRMSSPDYAKLAQMAMPRRLSPGQLDPVTGRISWPILLRGDEYAAYRAEVEEGFTQRVSGLLTTEDYLQTQRFIGEMTNELRDNIRSLPPADYLAAKSFLRSLAVEVRSPIEPVVRIGMAR